MKLLFALVLLSLVALSTACSDQPASPPSQTVATAPLPPSATTSYAAALLRNGLVAPAHRQWVVFCDTTRQQRWQLGHTPQAVWSWLADYEQRLEEKQAFNPAAPARRPTALDKLMEREKVAVPVVVPATAADKQAVRAQTTQLVRQLRQAGLLTAGQYHQLLPCGE